MIFQILIFHLLVTLELDLLLRRASAQGYTQFDLLKIARSQGLSQSEIEKLDKRFKSAELLHMLLKMHRHLWKILD